MTVYPSRRIRRRRAVDVALFLLDHAGYAILALTALMAITIQPVYWILIP